MTIRFADGTTDARPTIAMVYPGYVAHAVQVNSDMTINEVLLHDKDETLVDRDYLEGEYKTMKMALNLGVDDNRWENIAYDYITLGDELMVFKGRKYAKGTTFYVTGKFEYDVGRSRVKYVTGWDAKKGEEIKVSLDNCIYIRHDDDWEQEFLDEGKTYLKIKVSNLE